MGTPPCTSAWSSSSRRGASGRERPGARPSRMASTALRVCLPQTSADADADAEGEAARADFSGVATLPSSPRDRNASHRSARSASSLTYNGAFARYSRTCSGLTCGGSREDGERTFRNVGARKRKCHVRGAHAGAGGPRGDAPRSRTRRASVPVVRGSPPRASSGEAGPSRRRRFPPRAVWRRARNDWGRTVPTGRLLCRKGNNIANGRFWFVFVGFDRGI